MIEANKKVLKRASEIAPGELVMYAAEVKNKFALKVHSANAPADRQTVLLILDEEYEPGKRSILPTFDAGNDFCVPLGAPVFEFDEARVGPSHSYPDLGGGELILTMAGLVVAARKPAGYRNVALWNVETGLPVLERKGPEHIFGSWQVGIRNNLGAFVSVHAWSRPSA